MAQKVTKATKDIDPVIQYAFYDELIFKAYPEHIHSTFEVIHRTLGNVRPEKLLEVAIAVQGMLTRYNTTGMDYTDGSDAKSVSVRMHNSDRSYGAPVTGIFLKRGLLRVMVFERQFNKFYYFLIPYSAYKDIPEKSNIEIPFTLDGNPRRENNCNTNWWAYEVPDFKGILAASAPTPWFYKNIITPLPEPVQLELDLSIEYELDQCLPA